MLNPNVIKVLQEVQRVTNTVVLSYPVSVFNSPTSDMLITVDLSVLDSDALPHDLGIYNLSELLNNFALFGDEREVKCEGTEIHIVEGIQSAVINTASLELELLGDYQKPYSIMEKVQNAPSVLQFELDETDLAKMAQGAKVNSTLDEIVLDSTLSNQSVQISMQTRNNFNAKSNSFSRTKNTALNTKEFKLALPAQNWSKIPKGTYDFHVKYDERTNSYRLLLISKDLDKFNILMMPRSI